MSEVKLESVGIEPTTSRMQSERSAPELTPHFAMLLKISI